jgi:uncharacterized repeat protein (TIGR03847 family)
MSASFEFKAPDLFTAGALGRPGQRVFYLQARQRRTVATLRLEKDQVNALAEYLGQLLEKLPAATLREPGDLALLEPVEAAWVVGSLGVAYEEGQDRIVVVAEELREEDAPGQAASARFHLSRAQAAAFVDRARGLVKAGRKPCRVCGRPMNPDGHVCPRSNGRRHD